MKILLFSLIFLVTNCRSIPSVPVPTIQDCIFLSQSILCTDDRINELYIDKILQDINASDSLSEQQKLELGQYFNSNRALILEKKEFEIPFEYKEMFIGYSLTNPLDRDALEKYNTDMVNAYDIVLDRCGRKCKNKE